jgi:invasion protein IalB
MTKIIAFIVLAILCGATGANAQVKDQAYKDWTVYTMIMDGKKTCYITSFPKQKSGNYKKRDEPYLMVTRVGDGVAEVSTSAGYKYASGSKVQVTIDKKKLTMFTGGEVAWANDKLSDQEFVAAMKKASGLTLKSTSAMGSYSIDKYSLNGFGKAYDRMFEACK